MKTPKRSFNFRDDDSWGAMFYNSRTWRDNSARWKRKNKEAQLKRTIARQKRVWKDYLDVIELYFGDEMNPMWWQDQEGS